MNDKERNNLQEIITQSLEVIKEKMGAGYAPEKVNLAEMERLTGLSRSKLRTLKENGFVVKPHGNSGRKREVPVLTGFTGVIDDLLSKSLSPHEEDQSYGSLLQSLQKWCAASLDNAAFGP